MMIMMQGKVCFLFICAPPQPNGMVCTKDSWCQSGKCVAGFCAHPCTTDSNCPADKSVCVAFFCTAKCERVSIGKGRVFGDYVATPYSHICGSSP